MSLDWNVSAIEDKDFVWIDAHALYGDELPRGIKAEEKYLNPTVESAIYATMNTGINPITVDNYEEFYKRYLMLCKASGYDSYLLLEDAKKCIGLSTNASTKTYPAFKKNVLLIMEREINWKVKLERDKSLGDNNVQESDSQ